MGPLTVRVRWAIGADTPEILAIELGACKQPWDAEDYRGTLKDRELSAISMVADLPQEDGRVVGYMVFSLRHQTFLRLLRLAVHPDWQRYRARALLYMDGVVNRPEAPVKGVGTALLTKLVAKVGGYCRRQRIVTEVPESALALQLLLRENGFLATRVVRDAFGEEDGYVFHYLAQSVAELAGEEF